jgi:type I restriction enzyme S subunit
VVGFNAYPTESSEAFMHYVFSFIRNSIQNSVNGSIQDNINIKYLSSLDFKVPDKIYQDKIVHILSLFDRKIELNNRIVEELEKMAKAIYDYWFVQFDFPNADGKPYRSSGGEMVWNDELKRELPKGWSTAALSTQGEFKNGINYDKDSCQEKTVKIINVRDISSSSSVLLSDTLDSISLPEREIEKYLVEKNDILIARSGIPGATRIMPPDIKDTIYCGFIIRYRVKNEILKPYLYFTLKEIEHLSLSQSGGTILKNISQDTLKDILAIVPDETILTEFNNLVKPIVEQQITKNKENIELAKLRDWLLPMLMNGQVTVE